MITYVMQKIKNKGWLSVCLLLGLTFLVAVLTCQPVFKYGSLDRLLLSVFEEEVSEKNIYPAVMGVDFVMAEGATKSGIDSQISVSAGQWEKDLSDLSVIDRQTVIRTERQIGRSRFSNAGLNRAKSVALDISCMPDLESHAVICDGTGLAEYQRQGDEIPCLISARVMDQMNLTVGETVDFYFISGEKKTEFALTVAGIYAADETDTLFWQTDPATEESACYILPEDMERLMENYPLGETSVFYRVIYDYRDMNHTNIERVKEVIRREKNNPGFSDNMNDAIKSYDAGKRSILTTLFVLELPMLGMVLAFIYMVSGRIIDSEIAEIATLRSRGISKLQVIGLYALSTAILSLAAIVIGLPLGYGLCRLSASATDFLTFEFSGLNTYAPVWQMLPYALMGAAIGIFFVLLPVVLSAGVTIVQQKSRGNETGKPLWEKFYLDIVLLLVSVYMLYNFNNQKDSMRLLALSGNHMDPLMFLDSTIFVIAAGLFTLRLIHMLVRLIYRIGRRRWKPVAYASFLQITRTVKSQGFIAVFMILTVSLGLFNANAARTINRNYEDRIDYNLGADLTLQEHWKMTTFTVDKGAGPQTEYEYNEPDYSKYEALVGAGLADRVTRVIVCKCKAKAKKASSDDVLMMGISTKAFGETASLDPKLSPDIHWYHHLNALAEAKNGVIVSSNLAKDFGVGVGDRLTIDRNYDITPRASDLRGTMNPEIVAVVDNWPGYNRYHYEEDEKGKTVEKERYLVVANYASVVSAYKISPYQIWIDLAEGATADEVSSALTSEGVEIDSLSNRTTMVKDMKESAIMRITNGMFTLSFMVAIVLCSIGFLIYWISSIKQRELLFGVYRAMGLRVKDINHMLVTEHMFSTVLTVLAGGLVGVIATLLFAGLYGVAYLPEKHNVPMAIYYEAGDVIKLAAVILVMLTACALVLRKLVRSLNITQALKLGED